MPKVIVGTVKKSLEWGVSDNNRKAIYTTYAGGRKAIEREAADTRNPRTLLEGAECTDRDQTKSKADMER
jgi:hypothetical protein